MREVTECPRLKQGRWMSSSYRKHAQLQMSGVNCTDKNQPHLSHELVLCNLKNYEKKAKLPSQKRRGEEVRMTLGLPRIKELPKCLNIPWKKNAQFFLHPLVNYD